MSCNSIDNGLEGGVTVEENKDIVKYHNELVNTKLLDLQEKEIDLLVALIYKLQTNKSVVTFETKEIKKIVGYQRESHKRFYSLLKNLSSRWFYVKALEDYYKDGEVFAKAGEFVDVKLFYILKPEEKEKRVKAIVNDIMKPYIYELKRDFTQHNLFEFLKLPSKYSKRIYQICRRWLNFPGKVEYSLKELIEVADIPETYKWNDIKKRVLERAKKDINTTTSILFDYKAISKGAGKGITHIEFIISRKRAISADLIIEINKARKNLYFMKACTTDKEYIFSDLLEFYSEDEIAEALKVIKKELKTEVKSLKGYIEKVIKSTKDRRIKLFEDDTKQQIEKLESDKEVKNENENQLNDYYTEIALEQIKKIREQFRKK